MERYQTIGSGVRGSWPYEVAVHWPTPGTFSFPQNVIALSEGTGHGNQGGTFALADLLKPIWTEHLELCDCLWLRDLAREEAERGTLFSADEIWARFRERLKS